MFIKFRKSIYCESDIYLIFLGIVILSIIVPSLGMNYVISPLLDFCIVPLLEQYITPLLAPYFDPTVKYFSSNRGFFDIFMRVYSQDPTTLASVSL